MVHRWTLLLGLGLLAGCLPAQQSQPFASRTPQSPAGTPGLVRPTTAPGGVSHGIDTATDAPISSAPNTGPSPTLSPSATTAHYTYFFPLQPPDVCDFAPGVVAHGYPAIDIFAPRGTDFVAVTGGVVDFVSTEDIWDPTTDDPAARGGLAVAIVGEDGIRYYGSHLSEVEHGIIPGVRVEPGQLLGKVGNSGSARGKDTHLHFGISWPTYPEDWHARRGELDPFPYLEAWEIGIDITPRFP